MGLNTKTFETGITLDPQSADPSSPSEGQIQYSDGTARAAGLWQYKAGNWQSIGGGAGDADTIKLYRAASDALTDFTIKSIDTVMPTFNSTATLAMSVTVPTTGSDALLSVSDANKVYKFASAASSQWDAQGLAISIPKYARGKDLLFQCNYRTSETVGTPLDGDWKMWLWDATNGSQTTTSSTGAQAAGTSLTVASSTGFSVGDKVWVGESGGTAQVTEGYVTAIADSTHLTLSVALTLTSGDRIIKGILNDVITAPFAAATSDTNKEGSKKKIVVPVPATCTQVNLLIQQAISQTDSILFVDNILVSSNPFYYVNTKQVSEAIEAQTVSTSWGSTNTGVAIPTITKNTNRGTILVVSDATNGTYFQATRDCELKISANILGTAAGVDFYITKNATILTATAADGLIATTSMEGANYYSQISANISLSTGDKIRIQRSATTITTIKNLSLTATADINQSILVESTDSVTSAWTAYTPTLTNFTATSIECYYRRVGGNYEIRGKMTISGTSAAEARLSLPNGAIIDSSMVPSTALLGSWSHTSANTYFGTILVQPSLGYLNFGLSGTGAIGLVPQNANAIFGAAAMSFNATIPIAGLNSYPKPILAFPTVTYGQSAEHFSSPGVAGMGSTNTKIPYFSAPNYNTIQNLGVIDYGNTTLGFSFTATKRCKVTASYTSYLTGLGTNLGWSLNSNQLTTSIISITSANRIASIDVTAGLPTNMSVQVILNTGDILRPHTGAGGVTANAVYPLTLLAEPEEGQVNQAAIIAQPVAWVKEVQTEGTAGGATSATTLTTRTLNTLSGDIAAVGVTLSSNAFTLPVGKYTIEWSSPTYGCGSSQSQLFNNTTSKIQQDGNSCDSSVGVLGLSLGSWTGSITQATAFLIKHYTQGARATDGFGVTTAALNAANTATTDIYTTVKIQRHA
jgi:hypothetical protein